MPSGHGRWSTALLRKGAGEPCESQRLLERVWLGRAVGYFACWRGNTTQSPRAAPLSQPVPFDHAPDRHHRGPLPLSPRQSLGAKPWAALISAPQMRRTPDVGTGGLGAGCVPSHHPVGSAGRGTRKEEHDPHRARAPRPLNLTPRDRARRDNRRAGRTPDFGVDEPGAFSRAGLSFSDRPRSDP